ncbi:MAG TPA: hypothetical protein PLG77_12525 [Burkholderiaceae bacterium]|nr:hypothetical protein [Burkholderiaceae bacterium]
MSKLRIEHHGSELVVHFHGPQPAVQGFYDAMKECRRTGVWSCPSGECVHVERCEVQRDGDAVVLRLTPPAGETLSAAGIDECMRYVIGKPAAGG